MITLLKTCDLPFQNTLCIRTCVVCKLFSYIDRFILVIKQQEDFMSGTAKYIDPVRILDLGNKNRRRWNIISWQKTSWIKPKVNFRRIFTNSFCRCRTVVDTGSIGQVIFFSKFIDIVVYESSIFTKPDIIRNYKTCFKLIPVEFHSTTVVWRTVSGVCYFVCMFINSICVIYIIFRIVDP